MSYKLLDKDIREPLFEFLEITYGKIRILEEKNIGRSRADVVMVMPDALCGIEIKSDADSYARLSGQIKDYDRYYDYNYIAIGTTHALHIKEHIPEYWGIITVELVDGMPDFYIYRKPLPNPNLDPKKKLSLLWRPELAQIQEKHQLPKYKDKNKLFVIEKILACIPDSISEKSLNEQICSILLERDYNTVHQVLKEYRKSEIQKKLETETDPAVRMKLIQQAQIAAANLPVRHKRSRRRKAKLK